MKKTTRQKHPYGNFTIPQFLIAVKGVFDVPKQLCTGFVDDAFCLPNRQIKFFCKSLKCYAINKPPFENLSVSFGVAADDPAVDVSGYFVG